MVKYGNVLRQDRKTSALRRVFNPGETTMNILKYAFHVTPAKRRAIAVLAMVVTLTSTNVQAAHASDVLPTPPSWVTDSAESNDTTKERGIVVPENAPVVKDAVEIEPIMSVAKPAKKKWNTVNAPDLTTPVQYSKEPAVRTMKVLTSAYNSEAGQTDSSPFTTADGTQVRDGIVAANFLPHGTRIRIPDYFGDKVFEVHDRMNARYTYKIDIWMTNKPDAFKWGVRNVKIEILP